MISIHQPRMTITISRDHCGLEFLSTRKGMAEGSHEIEQQAKVCITCDLPVDDVKVEFINTPICNFIHHTNIICGVSPPRLQRCGHCSGSQTETLAPYVGQGKMFFFNWTTMDHYALFWSHDIPGGLTNFWSASVSPALVRSSFRLSFKNSSSSQKVLKSS